MNLMPCRFENVVKIFQGLMQTGIPLIAHEHNTYRPACLIDDIGIYVLVPNIAHFFSLSIEQAIQLFFYVLLLLPYSIGIVGFLNYYTTHGARIMSIFVLTLLTYKAYLCGDVYLAYYASIVSALPWTLYFFEKKKTQDLYEQGWLFGVGFCAMLFHIIRAYASIGALIFIYIFMLTKRTKKEIALNSLLMLFGSFLCYGYFFYEQKKSLTYAQTYLHNNNYSTQVHPMWHNIYIGFGFLHTKNNNNITYSDECAFRHAQSVDSSVTQEHMEQYEHIVKNNVLDLWHNQKDFVLFTIFAKLGVILFYILVFANIGLFVALVFPKPWYCEFAFFLCLSFYALFPMLAIPTIGEYALGLMSTATLYGIVSINYALKHMPPNLYFTFLSRFSKKNSKEYV